jgi:hypothetical protein
MVEKLNDEAKIEALFLVIKQIYTSRLIYGLKAGMR